MKKKMSYFEKKSFPNEQQERASLLHEKEDGNLQAIENIIYNEFCQGTFDTKLLQEFATSLGVNEKCLLDIRSIMKAFRKHAELRKLSPEEAKRDLEIALKRVNLDKLAVKVERVHSNNASLPSQCIIGNTKSYVLGALLTTFILTLIGIVIFLKTELDQVSIALGLVGYTSGVSSIVQGFVGIDRKKVRWIKSCPSTSNYTDSLDSMDKTVKLYSITQVEDEIWLCGGQTDDRNIEESKTCRALSLGDGKWRQLDQKMNLPRIRPVMFVIDRKVIVMGGSTSDVNIESGCRNTQEVFDLDNPSLGWQKEDIAENYSCHSSTQIVTIDCG